MQNVTLQNKKIPTILQNVQLFGLVQIWLYQLFGEIECFNFQNRHWKSNTIRCPELPSTLSRSTFWDVERRRKALPAYWYSSTRGADKSLARPGRKQSNVSVRIAWISFGALPCRKKKETWWQLAPRCCWNRERPWHASELVSFLVGLRIYQHPGIYVTQTISKTTIKHLI